MCLHAQEIDLGIERVAKIAEALGVTKPAPFVISVAGTNGKGSSVNMLASILKASGYNVGTYTSPHILLFNERIQINAQMVKEAEIVAAFYEIEQARGQLKLTYFEFATLAALVIFKQKKVDVAVLEVGLGGRLDAVNLVDADAALISAIGIDHIEWLGSDRSVIATEKAGITRAHKPAVCSDPNPPQSLWDYALQKQVPLSCLGRDFTFQSAALSDSNNHNTRYKNDQAWSFSFKNTQSDLVNKPLPLPALNGAFQIQNAAGVLALLCQVHKSLPVGYDAVCKGLRSVTNPGRLQQITINNQAWLIDVAHNPQSAQALAEYLTSLSQTIQYNAVFSVLSDKDSLPMVQILAPFIDQWFIADLSIARATPLPALKTVLLNAGVAENKILFADSIDQAVDCVAKDGAHPVLVWGSFFTVSQTLSALQKRHWY